jgi:tRNA threonylcarbamoyl adenosine modification protein YeaZ
VSGPITLAIEVSNPSAVAPGDVAGPGAPHAPGGPDLTGPTIALARGAGVFEQEALSTADSRHDDDLMPAIDRMVRRAGLAPLDIARVAVSIGPGGFTGLRVAVATAKAIGEATIARLALKGDAARVCVGVPSAHVAALNWLSGRRAAAEPAPFAVALASKRDTAWLTTFSAGGEPGRGALAGADALASARARAGLRVLLADRFLPESMRDRAAALGIAIEPPVLSAAACARVAAAMPGVDPAALLPLYPREPEAVTKWRALHGEP